MESNATKAPKATKAQAPAAHLAAPASTIFRQPLVDRSKTRALVLMYHSIDRKHQKRSVHPQVFRRQLVYLRSKGVEIIRMSQLIDFLLNRRLRLPAKVAVVTIDDGEATFLKNGLPHLVALRVPFALGIISKVADSDSLVALNWSQLKELLKTGLCEIASHGHTHVGLRRVTAVQRRYELAHSRNQIERHLKIRPRAFMYPLGSVDFQVAELAKEAGYDAAFSAVGKTVMHDVWRHRIPRFDVRASTPLGLLMKWFSAPKAAAEPSMTPSSPR